MWEGFALQKLLSFLVRLDKVQEELLYYPRRRRWRRPPCYKNVKDFMLSFLCDGQGAVRQAILSLWQVLVQQKISVYLIIKS